MNVDPPYPEAGPARDSARLQQRRGHFDQLVLSVEDYAIYTLDPNGIILDWNRGAERIKMYSPAEIVGHHFSRFYPEEDRASRLPEMELEVAAKEGRFAGEGWRLRRDGTRFRASVTVTAIQDESGNIEGFLKITRDLTERDKAIEILRQSEERFRLLLENVEDYAIIMLDPEGHVVSWNSGARRIKGYEQPEIVGRHFSAFYPMESAHLPQMLLARAVREGRVEDEGWRLRKDGTKFWGNVILTALRDDSGELRGFAKITRDLTEQRRYQQMRDASKRKDAFLATLAHELRNPLAPMLPGLELILNSPADPELVARIAGMLHRQVDQMSRLIDDLLDVSRITTGKVVLKKSSFPIADVVERALESVKPAISEHRHQVTIELAPDLPEVEADPHRLAQVISNLLSNAARYTPPGGQISLTAAVEDDSMLRLAVKDNGKGVDPALQASIFDLFDQGGSGSADGLGIGLTLVRSLVEMHGGTVAVESGGPGTGSEFILMLPILSQAKKQERADPGKSLTLAMRSGPLRVLVADDGKNAADILAMFFQMEGMETAVAYDGRQAVESARSFAPHLICLDLGMPLLDGFEAARLIRKMHPAAVIAALSGWGSEDDRRRTAEAGFDAHLVKPVKPDDLRELLARYGRAG